MYFNLARFAIGCGEVHDEDFAQNARFHWWKRSSEKTWAHALSLVTTVETVRTQVPTSVRFFASTTANWYFSWSVNVWFLCRSIGMRFYPWLSSPLHPSETREGTKSQIQLSKKEKIMFLVQCVPTKSLFQGQFNLNQWYFQV